MSGTIMSGTKSRYVNPFRSICFRILDKLCSRVQTARHESEMREFIIVCPYNVLFVDYVHCVNMHCMYCADPVDRPV